jgi:hydrogenase maturation factor
MCLGRIGVVTRVWDADGVPMAIVEMDGRSEEVSLLTAAAEVGNRVVVQFGFVAEVLTEEQAHEAVRLRSIVEPGHDGVHSSRMRRNEP